MEKIKLQDIQLQSLRIPAGWHIVYNHFCDMEPGTNIYVDGLPDGDVWELFLQDLLLMENAHLNLALDLGWVPEADLNGKYKLTLLQGTEWENPIAFYKTSSKSEIVDKINSWLHITSLNELAEVKLDY
jgi:hypothetical protein